MHLEDCEFEAMHESMTTLLYKNKIEVCYLDKVMIRKLNTFIEKANFLNRKSQNIKFSYSIKKNY